MRLKGLDLNLLVALDALLDERSVSRAAERLHLSQPAASAALSRLRDYFHDELLVLHGKRMIPTSYAQSLAPEVKRILAQVENVISMSAEFDPARAERLFRLMASDYITTVLVTPVAAMLERLAPSVKLDIRLPEDAVLAEFERGEIDLILVPEEFLSPLHPAELMFEEPHVVLGWRENPIFEREVTVEAVLEAGHVSVTLGPTRGPVFTGRQLEKLGHRRRIDVFAPNFAAVPWFLIGTNRLAVMQERLAKLFTAALPLSIAPLPMEFPSMRLMAQYHSAREKDQGLKWLRGLLHNAANDTAAGDVRVASHAARIS